MQKIRFAVIGLGCRGYSVLRSVMLSFEEIEVVAPQAIPDFTDGRWILRSPMDVVDFSEL